MRIIKKAGYLILVLVCVSFLSFLLANISAIDPAEAYARRVVRSANKELIAQYRELTGFDKTILQQYLSWLHKAVRLDFGASYLTKKSVRQEFGKALPLTLLIAACPSVFSIIAAVPLGIAAALYKNRLVDKLIGFIFFELFRTRSLHRSFGFAYFRYALTSVSRYRARAGGSVLFASFTLALPMTGTLIRLLRFLKIEQLNKVSTFEVVQFVRDSAHVNKRCLRSANSTVNEAAQY